MTFLSLRLALEAQDYPLEIFRNVVGSRRFNEQVVGCWVGLREI